MGVRESIYKRNTTHEGLLALIGTRCYPQLLPDNAKLPCVVYNLIGTPPNNYGDHDASPPDPWTTRIQMDAYATTSDGVHAVGEQLFNAWEGYHSGTAVGWAWVKNQIDSYDLGLNLYRQMTEVVIDYKR